MSLIKSISGIRGTIGGPVNENLTPLDIVKFTAAYCRWVSERTDGRRPLVAVGRDARISGPMVRELVIGTLMGCGADIIDLGLCTTPGVELAVITRHADGGIIITASHNPRQWNALKLLNSDGEFLSDAEGRRVIEIAAADDFNFVDVDALGRVVDSTPFDKTHVDMVLALPEVDAEAVAKKAFKVVLDPVNSVGGIVMPMLLERLGVEVVKLNCTPDGNFAHDPEPIAKNLSAIRQAVIDNHADLGIVVDPDVDRLAFVCEDGELFGEEYTLVAVADYILSRKTGNTVSNLSSTRALRDVTAHYGGQYNASAVGEVNVVAEMKRTGAVIGGEGNGGVIYPDLHYGRDALVGTALFLTLLARSGKSMTQLRSSYPQYFMSKDKVTLTAGVDVKRLLAEFKRRHTGENITDIDGVKIDFEGGWVHVRSSNTEPIVRVYAESSSQAEADGMVARFIEEVKACAAL